MITADPAAVVTRYIHAVRDGDRGAIRDSFAENATWDYPGDLPLSGTWRGRDTIVDDFLGSVGTALEPGSAVALEVTNVLSVGDQVIAEWISRATARGGAAYHNRNIGIFTVRDARSPLSASTPTPSTPRTYCSVPPDACSAPPRCSHPISLHVLTQHPVRLHGLTQPPGQMHGLGVLE
jgi:ketosteroid isomerase-like protein